MMTNPVSFTQTNYLNLNTDALANAFFEDLLLQEKEEKTAKEYRKTALNYMIMTGTEQFRKDSEFLDYNPHLMTFLKELRQKEYSYSYLKTQFTALNSFYNFLILHGHIKFNPVGVFRKHYLTRYKPPTPAPVKQCNPDEIAKLIESADSALWRAVLSLYAATGMRREELCTLNVGSVDFEKRILYVPEHKKRSNCRIVFSEWALSYLLDYLELRIN